MRIKCNSNNDGISYSVLEIYLVSRVDTNCFTAGRFQPSILPENNNRKREGKICVNHSYKLCGIAIPKKVKGMLVVSALPTKVLEIQLI